MSIHTAEITIHASAQRVFETLTQPELVRLWQYGRTVVTDWKVGSPIKFRSEGQGKAAAFEEWGTILEIRPNALLKYSLFAPLAKLRDLTCNPP